MVCVRQLYVAKHRRLHILIRASFIEGIPQLLLHYRGFVPIDPSPEHAYRNNGGLFQEAVRARELDHHQEQPQIRP